MLHCLEYNPHPAFLFSGKFIACVGKSDKDYDYQILPGKVTDLVGECDHTLVASIRNDNRDEANKNILRFPNMVRTLRD